MRSRGVTWEMHRSSVITLINSSVGVVALAMPYCFKQCGIILSTVFILISAAMCALACDTLINLCLSHKTSSLEKTCFRYLGLLGKLVAELSIMGLMVGSIIGYNVSLADLGADIALKIYHTAPSHHLRLLVLVFLTAFVAPLCLIPKVQGFTKISACAMFFYALMIVHMICTLGGPTFLRDSPLYRMNWWRTAGLVQCAPIFFASIFLQTQLHTIYAGLQQPSVRAMRDVVRVVIVILAIAYGLFGFFGYMAFADVDEIPGNVFLLYPDNLLTFCVKAGFLFTVSVSIPLTMFPLRQSIESFLFHRRPSLTADSDFIDDDLQPTRRFRSTTISLIILCFLLSLTTDKIVLIIQLTSSLAGSLIGYILPALAAIYAYSHHPNSRERRIGGCLLFVGVSVLVVGLISVHQIPQPAPLDPVIRQNVLPGAIDKNLVLKAPGGAVSGEIKPVLVPISPLLPPNELFDRPVPLGKLKKSAPNATSADIHLDLEIKHADRELVRNRDGDLRQLHTIPENVLKVASRDELGSKGLMPLEPVASLNSLLDGSNEREKLSPHDQGQHQDGYQRASNVIKPTERPVGNEIIKPPVDVNVRVQGAVNRNLQEVLFEDTAPRHPETTKHNLSHYSAADSAGQVLLLPDTNRLGPASIPQINVKPPLETRNSSVNRPPESLLNESLVVQSNLTIPVLPKPVHLAESPEPSLIKSVAAEKRQLGANLTPVAADPAFIKSAANITSGVNVRLPS